MEHWAAGTLFIPRPGSSADVALPNYQAPAGYRTDLPAWVRSIATFLSGVLIGRLNVVGEFTLTADDESQSTTVVDGRCHKYTSFNLDPLSRAASELLRGGQVYIVAADRTDGRFVVAHPPVATDDEVSFRYTAIG